MHRDAQQQMDESGLLEHDLRHELRVAREVHDAQTEAYAEAHTAFSERAYEVECKHERTVEVDCERTNTAAMVVENMHRDAQQQIDQNGLLEYDLGDAMEENAALKKKKSRHRTR